MENFLLAHQLILSRSRTQARVSNDTSHILINPFGMLYKEVTASSLIKIDLNGNGVEAGSTNFGVNVAGYTLHSALHSARPDIHCVIHLHQTDVAAVSRRSNIVGRRSLQLVCTFFL